MAKDDEYLESILKELYKSELDRADKLDGSVNLPTAVLTVLLGVGAFYVEHLPQFEWKWYIVGFYISLILFFGALTFAVISLVLSYFRYKYKFLSNTRELVEFSRQSREHYESEDDGDVESKVKSDMLKNLIDQYVECSTQNRSRNIQRTRWLFWTTGSIIACLISLGVSKVLYQMIGKPGP